MTTKERLSLSFFLLFALALLALDIHEDLYEGVSLEHVLEEGLILLSMLGAFMYIWVRYLLKKAKVSAMRKDLVAAKDEAAKFRDEAKFLARGISEKIEEQMNIWGFTESEVEIGFLMLKGLSSKEIAQIRGGSEATVRQHLNHIYKKSNLKNRAGFLAFFLEDLFVLEN